MPEINLPEEYYQANGYTKLNARSGPHPGADANLSFDIVEKQEVISAQPKENPPATAIRIQKKNCVWNYTQFNTILRIVKQGEDTWSRCPEMFS